MDVLNDPFFKALFYTPVPRIVLKTDVPHFTIVACNEAYKKATNTEGQDITGKMLWDTYSPDNAGGGKILMNALVQAIENNQPVHMPTFRYDISSATNIDKPEISWWQLEIMPVTATGGPKPDFLLLGTQNITEQTVKQQTIDDGLQREQILNEELAAFNEELTASNEELIRSQAALQALNNELEQRVSRRTKALIESEARFRNLVQQAPIGIAIYSGPEMIIELANEKIIEIWGRTKDIIGKPLLTGRPELKGHTYVDVITGVYTSGYPHFAYEIKGGVLRDGKIADGYFDVIYQPLKNNNDAVTGVIAVINEVTERVLARTEIEKADEMLRLAVEAAELGTWYLNAETREFIPSPRLKELFGYRTEENVSLAAAINQITIEYREKVATALENALQKGEPYNMEYPVVGYHDQKLRWLKATGRLYATGPGKPAHFSGNMVDITERRQNEQRKNDFISMVSHELKTPLTSLKAYLQLLQARAVTDGDGFRTNMLGKADMQVNKMHKMINGFLSVAALESGKMQLIKESFNMDKTVQEMVDDAIVSNPRFAFRFLPCQPLSVTADKDKIGQVITNLISNAVKYSPDGGAITITCEKMDNHVQVMVKDSGIGIEKANLPNLFERFYRVQSDVMKNYSGFGIGLYLCAEIVERHHGKIWAESEEGKGSAFYFTVPLSGD